MVDFNSEGTISKPPREVVALIIIEKLYNFLEADEHHAKTLLNGASLGDAVCRARLRSLFLVCHEMLKRRCKPDDYQKVKDYCLELDSKKHKTEPGDMMEAFMIILTVLDDLQLIKLDTKPVYNRHRTEEANKQHGYG